MTLKVFSNLSDLVILNDSILLQTYEETDVVSDISLLHVLIFPMFFFLGRHDFKHKDYSYLTNI